MRWTPERVAWRDFEPADPVFAQLLAALKSSKLNFRICTILMQHYPKPATITQLGIEWIETGLDKNETRLAKSVNYSIAIIRRKIAELKSPLEITKVPNFGYQLLMADEHDHFPWWAHLSLLEKKILLALILGHKIYATDHSVPEDSELMYYTAGTITQALSKLKKHLRASSFSDISITSHNSIVQIEAQTTNLAELESDLKFALQTQTVEKRD